MIERRKNRSPFKDEALRLWLQAIVQRAGCSAMAVGDETGFAAAGTDAERMEKIAATAAARAVSGQETITPFEESQMVIRTLEIDNQRMIVAAVGTIESCRLALEEAGWGVRRILD